MLHVYRRLADRFSLFSCLMLFMGFQYYLVADIAYAEEYVIKGKGAGDVITITADSDFGGAITSLKYRGKEYVDSLDKGREIQTAASFDRLGECFNPTEAGGRYNRNTRSSSDLISAKANGNTLETTVDMAFWLEPGEDYTRKKPFCGQRPSISTAQNKTILSGHLLTKTVTITSNADNVIDYRIKYSVPEQFEFGQFEVLAGYMPKDFSWHFSYDAKTDTSNALTKIGEQSLPLIFTTDNKRHAMGVYCPEDNSNKFKYGAFSFNNVTKWNSVVRINNVSPGVYEFHCYLTVGSFDETQLALKHIINQAQYTE